MNNVINKAKSIALSAVAIIAAGLFAAFGFIMMMWLAVFGLALVALSVIAAPFIGRDQRTRSEEFKKGAHNAYSFHGRAL